MAQLSALAETAETAEINIIILNIHTESNPDLRGQAEAMRFM
jgi:hypothetical protein